MAKLTLISAPTCPYVQRAVIGLKEKGVDFDVIYVDLQDRPDWFKAMSPLGKVPLLKVEREGKDDAVIFESAVILEYLEETTPAPHLHPSDPVDRAQNRAWVEFCSTLLGDNFKLYSAKTEEDLRAAKAVVRGKLQRVEDMLGEGPFFRGAAFSYVDCAFGPLFRQMAILDGVTPTGVLDGMPKVAAWSKALLERESVITAVPEDFAERYLTRLRAMGSVLMQVAA